MPRREMRVSPWFIAGAAVLLTPILVFAEPPGPGKQLRFKVSLTVAGTYQLTGPKTIPEESRRMGNLRLTVKQVIDNSYNAEYIVVSDPRQKDLQKTNPLDPASQQETDEYNTKVREQGERVYHSADNLRGKGSGAPAGMPGMNPMAMMNDPEFMKKIMACGQDQACKQKIAMEMMAQQQAQSSGPGAQVQADINAISDACIKKGNKMGSKGYQDCLETEGEKRSTVKRSAADMEAEIPELPDRYLMYSNIGEERKGEKFMDCQYKAHAKVNESGIYGVFHDMTNAYSEGSGTLKGESDFKQEPGSEKTNLTPCFMTTAVFDTKKNLYWGGFFSMGTPELIQTGADNGSFGTSQVNRDIGQWAGSALQGVPASGTKTQKFGYQTATLTWSITRE